jgi:pimeloyl-ACP methyl ester carboxylesterase
LVAAVYIAAQLGIQLRERESLEEAARWAPGSFITIEGKRVHVLERGSGSALVLIHGFGASTFDWEQHVLGPLARDHRVIAIDLWGHGFSARLSQGDLDFAVFADQVAAVLSALRIQSADVAGHSMGAAVSVLLAARHPALVDRLILVAGLAPQTSGETPLFFRILLTPLLGELALAMAPNLAPPDAPPDYRERMALVSRIPGSRASFLRYLRQPGKMEQLLEAYPRIKVPTLVIHGRDDDVVPFPSVERVIPLIRDVTVAPLDGKGHGLLWEAPDRVIAEMLPFLPGLGAAAQHGAAAADQQRVSIEAW